ncbi:permease YjgP/YjgQ family protein [Rhodomicrobium vannielii ATCC 17100]|uniref:Permease YjgP/YjgQ family protein n=1 Tax=Rhodomicrobium vannielii (strain ATCC 17100 / DSM 162 / LMG 4299 / NCIMB 10020 / ATH 3.1.1) TaxID=648757 RepID=E3I1T4_RHOVT|nr:LPS export ABC transporter permease LptF [Rhodomicrobium vannielii]ADP70153.1 permease YjgP/YjgQ family protein [Rhodomicrobium vannielii ATCC 17100]
MLISRYIFRQTASALIMILVSLTLIVWLTSLLREIKLLTAQGQTFLLFLQITALAIPSLIVTVAPVAFLIAALHSLNRLSGDSELIVLSAAGSSVWRLFSPYLFLAVVVSMCVLTANLFVLPNAARLLGDTVSQVRADVLSQVIQPGEFSDLEPGLTFHMRAKGDNGELLGVVVRDERDPKAVTTVIAEQGQILQDGGRASMMLHDGQIIRQQAEKTAAQVVVFTSYAFDIGDFSAKKGPRERKPRERDIGELLFPDKESPAYTNTKGSFRSEIHERFSGALYPIAFAIIAVLYLGRPKTTREGRTGNLFTAFTLGAAIRIAGIAGVNIVGKKAWALGLIYGIPVAVIVAGLVMLRLDIGAPVISLPSLRLPSFLKRGGSAPAARAS